VQSYTLQNDDGSAMNLAGKTFEFVVRPNTLDHTAPAMVTVNSTAATAQGYITVTTLTATVQVVLSPTATTLLGQSANPYTLWMDPGLPDATALVAGLFFCQLVAAA
jgi:hypothetical protein